MWDCVGFCGNTGFRPLVTPKQARLNKIKYPIQIYYLLAPFSFPLFFSFTYAIHQFDFFRTFTRETLYTELESRDVMRWKKIEKIGSSPLIATRTFLTLYGPPLKRTSTSRRPPILTMRSDFNSVPLLLTLYMQMLLCTFYGGISSPVSNLLCFLQIFIMLT